MGNGSVALVVDDEAKILEVVKSYLERDGFLVLTAQTGLEALEIARTRPVSLVILDLMLPDLPGEKVCARIRESSDVPIIMMTAKSDEESVVAGLGLGADDYVAKPFSPRELMARVAAAMRRSGDGERIRQTPTDGLRLDEAGRRAVRGGREIELTPSEYKILSLLMSSPRRIFTRDEIILAVKSDDYDGFDRTIDSHVRNLRRKIEDDPKSPRHVLTAHGFGYRYGGGQ